MHRSRAMLVTVVTDRSHVTVKATRATILVGRCTVCARPLEILTPSEDTDALCLACGNSIGRVFPNAAVTPEGDVVTLRRRRR
jgi:hypothetical protein